MLIALDFYRGELSIGQFLQCTQIRGIHFHSLVKYVIIAGVQNKILFTLACQNVLYFIYDVEPNFYAFSYRNKLFFCLFVRLFSGLNTFKYFNLTINTNSRLWQ